ncbi:unnamed protein product [Leuciscus chuanchicus]
MAFRNQMMLCYRLLTESVFSKNTEFGPGHGSFLAAIQGEFVKGLEKPPFTEVYVPDWVVVNGTEYRPGMTITTGCTEDGVPQFGLIKAIVTIGLNVDVKLVVKKWHTVGFDRHYFAYTVSPDEPLEAFSEVWYTPGRYRHPATGFLEERLRNIRKRLHSHSCTSRERSQTTDERRATVTDRITLLPDSQISEADSNKMTEWLKKNKQPVSQVEEYMRGTAVYRAQWIRENGSKSLIEITQEYPRLLDTPGMVKKC